MRTLLKEKLYKHTDITIALVIFITLIIINGDFTATIIMLLELIIITVILVDITSMFLLLRITNIFNTQG